jgi:hypothetical protein
VQQAHGSFRKFVLDHELDVVGAARFMAIAVYDSVMAVECGYEPFASGQR